MLVAGHLSPLHRTVPHLPDQDAAWLLGILPALSNQPLTPLGFLGGWKHGNTECIKAGMSTCTPKQSSSLPAWERLSNKRVAQGAVNPNNTISFVYHSAYEVLANLTASFIFGQL